MKKKISFIAFIIISLLTLSSCLRERKINQDESLLNKTINDNEMQISYRTPKGFGTLMKSKVDSLSLEEQYLIPFAPILKAIYIDTITGASITLSDMRSIPYEKTENQLDVYYKAYNPGKIWDNINIERFKLNDFPKVVELNFTNKDSRLLKLFFYDENKAKFCVNFYVPAALYENYKPYIESSIASFENSYTIIITPE